MDERERNICIYPYNDQLDQSFSTIGDIFSKKKNLERKKPFPVLLKHKIILNMMRVLRKKILKTFDDIISPEKLRPYLIKAIETGIIKFSLDFHK